MGIANLHDVARGVDSIGLAQLEGGVIAANVEESVSFLASWGRTPDDLALVVDAKHRRCFARREER